MNNPHVTPKNNASSSDITGLKETHLAINGKDISQLTSLNSTIGAALSEQKQKYSIIRKRNKYNLPTKASRTTTQELQ